MHYSEFLGHREAADTELKTFLRPFVAVTNHNDIRVQHIFSDQLITMRARSRGSTDDTIPLF